MEECTCRYLVDRTTHTEDNLQKLLGKSDTEGNEPVLAQLRQKARKKCQCSKNALLAFFTGLFPIFSWLRKYRKEWLAGDIVSGLTVGVVHIPQSMAFSILAGLAPVFGLYTSFYPVIIYTLMGTSRHISVGTFAVTSLLTRSVVFRYYPPDDTVLNGTLANNGTLNGTANEINDIDIKRAGIAAAVTFLMGVFQLIFGILRLGFITSYLSESLIQGFTTGAACQVVTSQTPTILGIKIPPFGGPASLIFSWIEIFKNLPKTHIPTLILTIVCIIFLTAGREINIRFKEKMKIPLPTEVILVIITILASHFGRFESTYDLSVVKNVPTGLPPPQLPNMSILGDIIGDGFAIAIVGFAISVSLSKMYGMKHGYTIDPNQELVAYGASNLIPSFFLCFPNAAALARCEIQDNTGGKTQVVGIISIIIVLIVVLVLGPIFEPLPRAVLGCIIIVGLFGILAQFGNLKNVYRTSKIDFVVWIITCLSVVVLGVDMGLLVGVVFSILTVIVRTQRPTFEVLSNVLNTDIYRPRSSFLQENTAPGIVIVKLHASLYYANKDFFKNKLSEAVGFNPGVVLAKIKRKKEEAEKFNQETEHTKCCSFGRNKSDRRQDDVSPKSNGVCCSSSSVEMEPPSTDVELWKTDVHTIIVDCGSFGFLDLMGAKTLIELCKQFKELGITFLLANCSANVRKQLMRSNYFDVAGENAAFISIHDAVLHAMHVRSDQVTK